MEDSTGQNEEIIPESEVSDVVEEEIKANETIKEGGVDFKAKYYYLAAEVENMRKRFEREKENLLKFGNEKVLSGLVGVIDNFDLTVNALRNDNDDKVQNIVKGIDMIRTQFLDVLKQNGLTQVESLGKVFDPNFHEAVAQAPAEGKQDQEIITEYQRGYLLNGRLLRASKVVVANNN
ncbi:MAG: nucleotide exchange factor GrpE [Bacteriovorax sp.]|jgi:molecular chaperone GrpE|nr:nucleotide exchange factor GrpE [Bacteriovorax sp.]